MAETPLVLCAIDQPGWCFDHIAQALQRELSQFYRFKISPATRITRETCDVLLALCWERALYVYSNVKCRGMVTCLYDHLSWRVNEHSRAHFLLTAKNSTAITVCNDRMKTELQATFPPDALPPVYVLEDGVDTALFQPVSLPPKVICGWTGMSTRCTPGGPEDYKGLGLLRQACRSAGVELRILDAASGGRWPLQRMPMFYADVSVQLIGSAYEGTPNPLLEALSMGRSVVTTNVGLADKLIKDGVTGFIVDRTPEAFESAIRKLGCMTAEARNDMSTACRRAAASYAWSKKAAPWRAVLQQAFISPRRGAAPPVEVVAPTADVRPVSMHPTTTPSVSQPDRRKNAKPRVLLISDVPQWAFHQNMRDLAESTTSAFDYSHWFVIDWIKDGQPFDANEFDVVFCVYHRWGIDALLPWDRTVGSLRALWFKPEAQRPPGPQEFELVNRFRAFHVVTQQNYDELKEHCPNVVYLTNPVNMRRFPTATTADPKERVIASWNGNAQHRSGGAGVDVKGFHSIVIPACEAAGVSLIYAEYNTRRLAHEDMPMFYMGANVAICASLYEGASNSVMEAMAAGQAVISTHAGNIVEIHDSQMKHYGESGIILVDRDVQSVSAALQKLRNDPARVAAYGKLNRTEIAAHWSWDVWNARYVEFLRKAL